VLLSRKKITEDLVDRMMGWRHSGFNVYCGPRIQPGEEEAMENLARYIIRASFSQERMTYIPDESKVIYRSKDGKNEKAFEALEWLAAMCSHVPNKGEQMVRYYGYYSNVSRGKRKKENQDERIPCILESDESSKERRKNWARLIQKIYEIDPLICPKYRGSMRIISIIHDQEVVKTIRNHLGLWAIRSKPPAKAHAPPSCNYAEDDTCHTIGHANTVYGDPDYPWEAYINTSRKQKSRATPPSAQMRLKITSGHAQWSYFDSPEHKNR